MEPFVFGDFDFRVPELDMFGLAGLISPFLSPFFSVPSAPLPYFTTGVFAPPFS